MNSLVVSNWLLDIRLKTKSQQLFTNLGAGFGQSRSEVRIMRPFNVERQMKVLQFYPRTIDIGDGVYQEGIEESFWLSIYNLNNKILLENLRNGGKYV